LDLTPVVDTLLERPFDRPTLDKVYSLVEGHPHAYATALRCAAKRTEDSLAAGYWLTEAARIHESVDDLGGAIALLSRARDCDPGNPRTRELLAACMTRLPAASMGCPKFTLTDSATPGGSRSTTLPDACLFVFKSASEIMGILTSSSSMNTRRGQQSSNSMPEMDLSTSIRRGGTPIRNMAFDSSSRLSGAAAKPASTHETPNWRRWKNRRGWRTN
jgi:hypothetical protein